MNEAQRECLQKVAQSVVQIAETAKSSARILDNINNRLIEVEKDVLFLKQGGLRALKDPKK